MNYGEIQNYFEHFQYQCIFEHPITQNYGCVGWFIFNKIKKAKLFRVETGSKFFQQLLTFYSILVQNNSFSNPNSFVNNQKIEYFFKCLIKLKDIKKILENIRLSTKDLTPIKFTLDILEHHYRTNDSPIFSFYFEILSVSEMFYSKISNDKLSIVNRHLDMVLSSIKDYRKIITVHDRKNIHLDYIKKQLWSLRNLTDLNTIDSYYQ
ncbi:hypothetical protein DICPUDRAFT_91663 [Dictyostelium purpureum]|uniref:Uncharacterized protein n=1 Tax=Dictyostelium purpureum TaxID=5786 RepID=F0ZFH9_DICPU|nr:uncharacterized protein DICPUDRAFT_91663 [Dictyostelium purpureum]EGC37280.1 hypothetical protein DICPUDRAFT_91663 [Dictyostelium purpureum]|eukprot:XP_003286168.1 hypothetical protein DICPUDRAFT_91663 [Dictyostelium purpureum]